MTTQLEQAARQALEALESLFGIPEQFTGKGGGDVAVWRLGGSYRSQQAITTLRAALSDAALDRMAENARELGLDYDQPKYHTYANGVRVDPVTGNVGIGTPEQPAQDEPVAWINWCAATGKRSVSFECESELASEPLYAGITQNTQRHYSKFHSWFDSELHRQKYTKDHPAYLAAQEAWNAANDDAQHRINRLSAEIEAWKARFKIAEDALVKINGVECEPVTFNGMTFPENSDCHGPDWTDRDGEYLK